MLSKNLRIILSELTIVALFVQSVFGIFLETYAVNPPVHELVPTQCVQSANSFVMSGTTYVAIANGCGDQQIIIPSGTGSSVVFQTFTAGYGSITTFQYFSIAGQSYLAAANNGTGSIIYAYSGGQFSPFQYLSSNLRATDFSFFDIGGTSYLGVADGTYGSGSTKILQWTGTGFSDYQSLTTYGATAIKHFQIVSGERELGPYAQLLADNSVIANQIQIGNYRLGDTITRAEIAKMIANLGGYTPTACAGNIFNDVRSDLGDICGYVESLAGAGIIPTVTANFYPYQPISRADATKWILSAVGETTDSQDAGYADTYDTLGDVNLNGFINRLKVLGCAPIGQYFRPNEAIVRGDAFKFAGCVAFPAPTIQSPSAEEGDYIVIFDDFNGGHSGIYRWDGSQFVLYQSFLPSNGGTTAKTFTIGTDQYIVSTVPASNKVNIYKWYNTGFVLLQSFQFNLGTGAYSDIIEYKGVTYLIAKDVFDNKSTIYAFIGGKFEPVQYIETSLGVSDIHKSWSHFTLSGEPYLFLGNSFNSTNSVIYKWSPLPYVVIKSPVSGEYNNYGTWNPGTTPITGIGTPGATVLVHDGSGAQIGSGTVSASGEFSINTTAGKYTPLPIVVTPYNQVATGEHKTIEYINITQPAPDPTSSHTSAVYRDPFTFTISGEPSFYTASGADQIHYDIYRSGVLSFGGDVDARGVQIGILNEDTTVQYYGKDASGATTPVQERKFYYDNTAPYLGSSVTNNIQGMWDPTTLIPASLEIKTAILFPPFSSRIYSFMNQEIGRFSLVAHNEAIRVNHIDTQAITSQTGFALGSIGLSATGIALYDADTNTPISSIGTLSGNTISFSGMNEIIPQNSTKNYKIIFSASSVAPNYGTTVTLSSPNISAVFDTSGVSASINGTAESKTYTISSVSPTVQVTALNETTFRVNITNPDSEAGISLSGANIKIGVDNAGYPYSAQACIRMVGSTDSCGVPGSTTAAQTVSGNELSYSFASIGSVAVNQNNGSNAFEVYLNSPYLLSTSGAISVAIEDLSYNVGSGGSLSQNYHKMTGSCVSYGAQDICNVVPAVPTNPTILNNVEYLYFATGSVADASISGGDATINFGGSGVQILSDALSPVLNSINHANATGFGDIGMTVDMFGTLSLTGGRNTYTYALTDLMGNQTNAKFSIYRLPDITNSTITHTGGVAKYSFTSDMSTPVEYSYTQSGVTHTGTIQTVSGENSITLTGVSLSGSVSGEVMIPQNLSDITLPGVVHHALKQSASYVFDPNPDTFAITKKLGVIPGSQVTFGPFTLTGFNVPTSASVNLGSLQVNGTSYGTGVATVHSGDIINIIVTARSNYSITYSGTLSLGTSLQIPYEIENALAPGGGITPPTMVPSIGPGGGGGGGGGSSSNTSNPLSQGASSSQAGQIIPIGIMLLFAQSQGLSQTSTQTQSTGDQSAIEQGQEVRHTDILQFLLDNNGVIANSNLFSTVNTYLFTPIYEQIQTIESHNRQVYTYNSLIRQGWRRTNEIEDSNIRRQLQTLNTQLKDARQELIFGN